jgi:hypothetical protein
MRSPLTIANLLLVLAAAVTVVPGQKVTCSCDKISGYRDCATNVTCSDGCTNLCGSGDKCYASCTKGVFDQRYTIAFVKKTGQEIASEMSTVTHQKIEFVPYRRNRGEQYDLNLKNDDLFNVLNYLNKRGNVRFNGMDFSKVRGLRSKKRSGKTISTHLKEIPREDVMATPG